jgi:hypothetical protein
MGSGYRVFTAGEVLTASNVQNYLQDQAVMVFGGTAARSSAIGTANFEEGMLTYLTDVDKLQVYTGAAFADVYPPTASSQGLTLISTTSFSAVASQSINDVFSATYQNYKIVLNFTTDASRTINFRWRVGGADNSTANSYVTTSNVFYNPATQATEIFTQNLGRLIADVNSTSKTSMEIYDPFNTVPTHTLVTALRDNNNLVSNNYILHNQSVSYTGISFIAAAGNMTGTVRVYGYNQ